MKKLIEHIYNLPIRYKLMMIYGPLFLIIAISYTFIIDQNIHKIQGYNEVVKFIETTNTIGKFIYKIQYERAYTRLFLASTGKEKEEDLIRIRLENDTIQQNLVNLIEEQKDKLQEKKIYEEIRSILVDQYERIKKLRNQVDEFEITSSQAANVYTDYVANLVKVVGLKENVTKIPELKEKLISYIILLSYHESVTQERGFLINAFEKKAFVEDELKRYLGILALQDGYKNQFFLIAEDALKDIFNKTYNLDYEKEVLYYRNIALNQDWEKNIKTEDWYNTVNKRIDNVYEIIDKTRDYIIQKSKNEQRKIIFQTSSITGFLILILVLSVFFTVIVSKDIQSKINNLKSLQNYASKIAQGDLTINIQKSEGKDETAIIINSFIQIVDIIKEFISNMLQISDLQSHQSAQLNTNIQQFQDIVKNIKEFSVNLSSSSEEMTSNLNVIASSIEEISITINEISKHTEENQKKSNELLQVLQKANQIIETLNKSTKQIEQVSSVISDIARQTNLLSLNAAIEAAGAGEKGSGFAVVANEVKELANKTHQELKQVNQNIHLLQESTNQTNETINLVYKNFQEFNHLIQMFSSSFYEQTAAIKEISNNINQNLMAVNDVNKRVNLLESHIQNIEDMLKKIHELSQQLKENSNKIHLFLSKYRT
ncbi:MAG: methyl-accepting chemotaxis protein [Leptospiraceae bacterium]|nr:methyl-accepting chemotaxis protein [Leptospiraceae bacterium]